METINKFVIINNKFHLNNHKIVVRMYIDLEKTQYNDSEYYLDDASYQEWITQQIAKHQLTELLSDEDIDISEYTWIEGRDVLEDPETQFNKMITLGEEAYNDSIKVSTEEILLDLDMRMSLYELGITNSEGVE